MGQYHDRILPIAPSTDTGSWEFIRDTYKNDSAWDLEKRALFLAPRMVGALSGALWSLAASPGLTVEIGRGSSQVACCSHFQQPHDKLDTLDSSHCASLQRACGSRCWALADEGVDANDG
ncbi:uncharacterized protein TRIVIDRAFT_225625 [Trichoderma virens Gv29-8]|uniref:Uncharacterized protein n=1 Tax=Hypocrea virens (strain Gv29-8 / FGSC 10586) TaxID=413071 RepID=G9N3Y3_HYPVG|nr:uncharacterized protein TRIVIDRAFT_225625 [Trichoderma virens Gv29-8]EHK18312.1 hypothetical protein TRIVIDRAFT_225625 [Trichoderma virens Gv29-8]